VYKRQSLNNAAAVQCLSFYIRLNDVSIIFSLRFGTLLVIHPVQSRDKKSWAHCENTGDNALL